MKSLSVKETEKECRKEASSRGLTFKSAGRSKYKYIGRRTGKTYRTSLAIGAAFDIACSDELDLYREN